MNSTSTIYNTSEVVDNSAHINHMNIVNTKKELQGGFLELARLLKDNRDNEYYKELDYDTFESYIASPEISFQRSTVYSLISVYERFVLEYGVQPAGLSDVEYTKLAEILPVVTKENFAEWLSKAASLSRSDLRAELEEYRNQNKEVIPLPEGKYQVIYADPPWEYEEHGVSVSDNYGAVGHHYQSMTIEELCSLPVRELAADNSALFIWVTSPKLNKVWDVINSWGFEYKTSFVWDKVKHNFGYYNSVRHELLLVCGRGSSTPEVAELFDSVQSIERTDKHSEKPEEFRKIIEKLYPSAKKIELFARKKSDGWDVWGNDANL